MTGESQQPEAARPQSGPLASIAALGAAVTQAHQSLVSDLGQDDVVALRCIIELDDSLPDLARLLALIPELVSIASPGKTVEGRIAGYQRKIAEERARLAAERTALDAAADLEHQLQAAEAERDQLSAQIRMLERHQQLTAELPSLRARLAEVQEKADDAVAGDAEQITERLVAAVSQLSDLTGQQRDLLGPELAGLVADAATASASLAEETRRRDEVTAELAQRRAEADALQHELKGTLADLDRHRRADQEVADGLTAAAIPAGSSSLARVQQVSGDIARQIASLDELLSQLLNSQAEDYSDSHRIQGWTG